MALAAARIALIYDKCRSDSSLSHGHIGEEFNLWLYLIDATKFTGRKEINSFSDFMTYSL